jgi:hypothetical protein
MEYEQGKTHFVILGEGELADIVELSLKNLDNSGLEYIRVSRPEDVSGSKAVILLAESKPGFRTSAKTNRYIDVLSALSGSQQ